MSYQLDLDTLKSELCHNFKAIKKETIVKLGHEGGVLLKLTLFKHGMLWLPYVITELGAHRLLSDDGFALCLFIEDLTAAEIKARCGWERKYETSWCSPHFDYG